MHFLAKVFLSDTALLQIGEHFFFPPPDISIMHQHEEKMRIDFAFPSSSSSLGLDNWVVPTGSPEKVGKVFKASFRGNSFLKALQSR